MMEAACDEARARQRGSADSHRRRPTRRAGVELQGRFAEQRLTHSTIANATTGLSGICSLEVQAMSLRLVAYLEALGFRAYSNTLTSWGSGWLTRELLNL